MSPLMCDVSALFVVCNESRLKISLSLKDMYNCKQISWIGMLGIFRSCDLCAVAMVGEALSLTLGRLRAPAYPALSSRHAFSSNIVLDRTGTNTNLGAIATMQILLQPNYKRQHQHASLTECGGSGDPGKEG